MSINNGTLVGPIDAALVEAEIERAIDAHRARFKSNWVDAIPPKGESDENREARLASGRRHMETLIDRERTFYSYAAIYKTADGKFRLVYDPEVLGTGPFTTADAAVASFTQGGR